MLSSCVSPSTTKTANIKRRYYLAAHRRVVNVLTSNSAFLISVCLSATSLYCIETTRRIELGFFAWELPLTYPTVLLGKSGTPKNKGTSLWNFAANSGLGENFATASRWCDQQNSSAFAVVDYTYTMVERVVTGMHKVYYASVHTYCKPLARLLRFVLDLLYNLFLLCRHRAWLGLSAVAELLVLNSHRNKIHLRFQFQLNRNTTRRRTFMCAQEPD